MDDILASLDFDPVNLEARNLEPMKLEPMTLEKVWKPDYTAYIRPELAEIIYDHARNNYTDYERFRKVWIPADLYSVNKMVLVFTEYTHKKYGKILVDKVLLSLEQYNELRMLNPEFEFFDGELLLPFKQLVTKTIIDPYMIYLFTEGSPLSFMCSNLIPTSSDKNTSNFLFGKDKDASLVKKAFHDFLKRKN